MDILQNVVMALVIVATLPMILAIALGWSRSPDQRVQRRVPVALALTLGGLVLTMAIAIVIQLMQGQYLFAAASFAGFLVVVLSGWLMRNIWSSITHRSSADERGELSEVQKQRTRLLTKVILGLALVALVLVIVAIFVNAFTSR